MRRRWWLVPAVAVFALLLVAVGTFFYQVHRATSDWWPSAVPTVVQYDDRDFSCGNVHSEARAADLAGMVPRGRTIGGGTIYAPPGFTLPIGIAVRNGDSYFYCSLSGGP
ncbi:hypothetical protein A0130_12960 [Leifsonia xyli]|uniref:hypothetical protein n=1 Tax=Leifsonia xyli TaxID=1575 RepID=UPI0007CDFF34|nr:hypothetical protein A0130_12960 [Leifsonia xyli]